MVGVGFEPTLTTLTGYNLFDIYDPLSLYEIQRLIATIFKL